MVGINSKEQKVKLDDGAEIRYDKLLLAPGLLLGTEISYSLFGRILKFFRLQTYGKRDNNNNNNNNNNNSNINNNIIIMVMTIMMINNSLFSTTVDN